MKKYFKILEPLCYVGGIYYSIVNLAQQNDIYFMAFLFVGFLGGLITSTIKLSKI